MVGLIPFSGCAACVGLPCSVMVIPVEAVAKVLTGEIADGKTQVAVLKVYTMLRNKGEIQ